MHEVLILRHGQTEWNLARRFQGARDSGLTDLGVRQARAQGQILAGCLGNPGHWRFLTSPQPRAATTARLALGVVGAVATPDPALCEISVGDWEGLTREEIAQGRAFDRDDGFWWMDAAPRGEGHALVAARVAGLLAGLTGPTVLVTHGITSCHLRGQLLGLDMGQTALLHGEQGVVYRIAERHETVLRAV